MPQSYVQCMSLNLSHICLLNFVVILFLGCLSLYHGPLLIVLACLCLAYHTDMGPRYIGVVEVLGGYCSCCADVLLKFSKDVAQRVEYLKFKMHCL